MGQTFLIFKRYQQSEMTFLCRLTDGSVSGNLGLFVNMQTMLAQRAAAIAAGALMFLSIFVVSTPVGADTVNIKSDASDRYIVKKGDTLWGIAGHFLEDPWRWPAIWKVNEQIENPHLIYPGDVIIMAFDENGNPILKLLRNQRFTGKTMKLSPGIYADDSKDAIPTIPPNVILPFLTQPLIVGRDELDSAGYLTQGVEDNIIVGRHQQFYARQLGDADVEVYNVFRPGRPLKDPDTGEILGYEAVYAGDGRVLRYAPDVSKLEIIKSKEEMTPGDRLLPAPPPTALPYYFPKSPAEGTEGKIIHAHNGVSELGTYSIVAINLGSMQNIETGTVLRVMTADRDAKDPVTKKQYQLPSESSGLIMVFRVFDRVSYALVMQASRQLHVTDRVVTP